MITLGSTVPELRVILQSGVEQSFALTIQVEAADLVGVDAVLDIGPVAFTATLAGTTYTWAFTVEQVEATSPRAGARLYLVNGTGAKTILGRGYAEVAS